MKLILDASMALSWLIARADPKEARLATRAFGVVKASGARIPAPWYPEIANTLLVFERAKRLTVYDSATFLSDLSRLRIEPDDAPLSAAQMQVMALGRLYGLTAYDAIYMELALRSDLPLATFDRQLAGAVRQTGGRVFGDHS